MALTCGCGCGQTPDLAPRTDRRKGCRTPACVRPDHLEPVSHAENMRRGANARLKHNDVRLIRVALANGSTVTAEAARHEVNVATIHDIVAGRSWVGVS